MDLLKVHLAGIVTVTLVQVTLTSGTTSGNYNLLNDTAVHCILITGFLGFLGNNPSGVEEEACRGVLA